MPHARRSKVVELRDLVDCELYLWVQEAPLSLQRFSEEHLWDMALFMAKSVLSSSIATIGRQDWRK